ncbi:predicted protein [Histoplasma capsulatum var. duboisii H88]|uniref:Predicted protein n=1 Tax=Ajellomyces capsulatus (strain H88) TaxID=544711 RepID=F0U922_AJEC8|nr:predicted protein [Histoplasma capsulatum var. duboisii H88]
MAAGLSSAFLFFSAFSVLFLFLNSLRSTCTSILLKKCHLSSWFYTSIMKNTRGMPLRVNMTSSGQFPVSPCLPVLSQGDNMTNPRFIVVRETKGRRYSHGFASSNQRYLWRLQRLQRLQRLRYPEDCGFSNAADARLHDAFP